MGCVWRRWCGRGYVVCCVVSGPVRLECVVYGVILVVSCSWSVRGGLCAFDWVVCEAWCLWMGVYWLLGLRVMLCVWCRLVCDIVWVWLCV